MDISKKNYNVLLLKNENEANDIQPVDFHKPDNPVL